MTNERDPLVRSTSRPHGKLDGLPQPEFVAAWKALVGEPPAAMLDSRSDMIRLLVESIPIVGTMSEEVGRTSPLPD
ncbi:hypothetical protein [Methylobacterium tardum]|uniref:Uncharacterized protein n=1 Tax=Methylobacterium tardum TaxID=374432 RepID=A0AA37TDF6_9HYPH|nr:hypothetical protein [Methylobacterium tardum]URD38140.1 hypothetical protein M6G65_06645 [Methylobacterium tardum]GLS71736.1 hypothetical protein GCM10007890_37490 [Methylobacterium tardum]